MTVVVTAWRESKRAEDARAERARDRRSDVYAEFYRVVAAFRRVSDELGEAASALGRAKTRFGQVGPVKTVARLTDEVRELADSAAMVFGQIRFLAPADVVTAAGQVIEALTPYKDALIDGRVDGTEAEDLTRSLDVAVRMMRLDLGPEPGSPPR